MSVEVIKILSIHMLKFPGRKTALWSIWKVEQKLLQLKLLTTFVLGPVHFHFHCQGRGMRGVGGEGGWTGETCGAAGIRKILENATRMPVPVPGEKFAEIVTQFLTNVKNWTVTSGCTQPGTKDKQMTGGGSGAL